MHDPLKFHGAWIVLFAAVGAGALAGAGRSVELGLLVGTSFAGGFLCAAALTSPSRRRARNLAVGSLLAAASLAGALALRADTRFLWIIAAAALTALVASLAALRLGFLSRTALVTGLAALTLAAPAAALAGGVGLRWCALLFFALWPFYCWRSLMIAERMRGSVTWDRAVLRKRGLREAAYTALWTLGVSVALS